MTFQKLGFSQTILSALESLDIETPTSVQAQVIPVIAEGGDVMVTAKTGSGKSLAYALPLLERSDTAKRNQHASVLVVVPTRELVSQLAEMFLFFTRQMSSIKLVELAGGGSINPQLLALRGGADFIIATPGRLLDVVKHNGLDLHSITTLVLDEADRLLDAGFQDETNQILDQLPECQRLFFSATFSKAVNAKAKWLLKNPLILNLTEPVVEIQQRVIQVNSQQRDGLLAHLLSTLQKFPALIFVADRVSADKLVTVLEMQQFSSASLHGKLSMAQRSRVLARIKEGSVDVVVASDLAARGIDIPSLPLVINYDLPRSTELYTHRIGRTGRAGQPGLAISLVAIYEEAHLALIEKRLGLSLEREQVEGFIPTDVLEKPVANDGNGGIKGHRMSKKDKLRAAANKKAS